MYNKGGSNDAKKKKIITSVFFPAAFVHKSSDKCACKSHARGDDREREERRVQGDKEFEWAWITMWKMKWAEIDRLCT